MKGNKNRWWIMMRNFVIVTHYYIIRMGGANSRHWREMYTKIWQENLKESDDMDGENVNGRIILN